MVTKRHRQRQHVPSVGSLREILRYKRVEWQHFAKREFLTFDGENFYAWIGLYLKRPAMWVTHSYYPYVAIRSITLGEGSFAHYEFIYRTGGRPTSFTKVRQQSFLGKVRLDVAVVPFDEGMPENRSA